MTYDEQAENDAVMLEDAQLRKVAKVMLRQEETLIRRIKSEHERAKYLKQSNDVYNNVISLLDECNKFVNKYDNKSEGSKDKAEIAKHIYEYITFAINMSMQCVRNCCLRGSYVCKIKDHFNSLIDDVDKLDAQDVTILRRLAKDVMLYEACMSEYASKCRSGSARALSMDYSLFLKEEGIGFYELVEWHTNNLGFQNEFEDLEEVHKLEVYNSIIEDSGRAMIAKIEDVNATDGVGLLLIAAGLMVWDICTVEHNIEAVLSNGLSGFSEKDTFAVEVVGVEEDYITTAKAEVELGIFNVSLAGFVVGNIEGLIFNAESGVLIEQILSSGGKVELNLDGVKFHSSNKMPDGMALAYETVDECLSSE